jgi:hypothetical protein
MFPKSFDNLLFQSGFDVLSDDILFRDIDKVNHEGFTIFSIVCQTRIEGWRPILEELIRTGANINKQTEEGTDGKLKQYKVNNFFYTFLHFKCRLYFYSTNKYKDKFIMKCKQ